MTRQLSAGLKYRVLSKSVRKFENCHMKMEAYDEKKTAEIYNCFIKKNEMFTIYDCCSTNSSHRQVQSKTL